MRGYSLPEQKTPLRPRLPTGHGPVAWGYARVDASAGYALRGRPMSTRRTVVRWGNRVHRRAAAGNAMTAAMASAEDPARLTPKQSLERLIAGNRRFCERSGHSLAQPFSRQLATEPPRPYATVLGCFDARVPIELLFDVGFGELFVVRIAGNIVTPAVIGSVEFAALQFGSPLVLVLGHTRCAAVGAAIEAIQTGNGPESQNIRSITERITPHLERLVRAGDNRALMRIAVRANVRASADALRQQSELLQHLSTAGRVAVVGAEYELESGEVHLVESVPALGANPSTSQPSSP